MIKLVDLHDGGPSFFPVPGLSSGQLTFSQPSDSSSFFSFSLLLHLLLLHLLLFIHVFSHFSLVSGDVNASSHQSNILTGLDQLARIGCVSTMFIMLIISGRTSLNLQRNRCSNFAERARR